MRLIVMGQQAFGKDALAKILEAGKDEVVAVYCEPCLLYTSPSPRDGLLSRMPSSA